MLSMLYNMLSMSYNMLYDMLSMLCLTFLVLNHALKLAVVGHKMAQKIQRKPQIGQMLKKKKIQVKISAKIRSYPVYCSS